MYKACIFDLDGTLCDSVESIAYCANQAIGELGMKAASLEDYKRFVGDGVDMLIRRVLRHNGDEACVFFEQARKRYMELFQEGCMYHVKPYPGMRETLEALKQQGALISVLSNKPHEQTRKVIESVFGQGYFDCILGQKADMPRKPDPSGALYVAGALGIPAKECLYVGDTGTDMETGTAAGMYTVGVLWGFRDQKELEESGACRVIAHSSALLEIYQGK